MLFKDQMLAKVNVDAGESLYFAGATLKPVNETQMMHIYAVKQADGKVRTVVEHLSLDPNNLGAEGDEVVFNKTFSPVTFERFINDMAMQTALSDKTNRLVELTYKARGITHPDGDRLDDHNKNLMHKMFLILATQYKDSSKAYDNIDELLKQAVGDNTLGVLNRMIDKFMAKELK